jgi:hypothetical protein
MRRAQGALEYMIIIAAVLAISAIVVLIVSGTFSTHSSSASLSACKQAAVDCKASRMLSPSDPCINCEEACKDTVTGEPVHTNAVECCQQTLVEEIYADSMGDNCVYVPPAPYCGDGNIDAGEVCDGTNMGTCTGTGATCEGCECYCNGDTPAGECASYTTFCNSQGALTLGYCSQCCPSNYECLDPWTCVPETCGSLTPDFCTVSERCSPCPYGGERCCPLTGGGCCGISPDGSYCCSSGYSCSICYGLPYPSTRCCPIGQSCQVSWTGAISCGT